LSSKKRKKKRGKQANSKEKRYGIPRTSRIPRTTAIGSTGASKGGGKRLQKAKSSYKEKRSRLQRGGSIQQRDKETKKLINYNFFRDHTRVQNGFERREKEKKLSITTQQANENKWEKITPTAA